MDTTEYLEARIEATQTAIIAYEEAQLALVTDPRQSYKVDTGQTVIQVTRPDLPMIERTIASLYNRLSTLQARLNGNQTLGVPTW